MRFDFFGMDSADVAEILATVVFRIAIENLVPKAAAPRRRDSSLWEPA